MKTYIRRREKNDSLVVMYGAWGTDENVFEPLCNDEFDFILFYNYSADQALVLPEMKTYKKITLIGWSIGVWAAEYLSPSIGIMPDVTIAVNGTPVPLDDNYGIPPRSFEEALDDITEESIEKFYYRMFGNRRTFNLNSDRIPGRTLDSFHVELRWLYNRVMEQREPGFRWDFAVTSKSDKVFPTENVTKYWDKMGNTRQIIVPFPHYMFYKWPSFNEFINYVEKRGRIKSVSPETTGL
ncbi:MAG TPA: DUF452 family protein [Bacteroidales bacterium]|jgi:biotin synthesis protein BioG|nr:DUF452 family protein [Bacteroidales bacterium]HOS71499.1 DUF452 family protein [Bacteroidales bacterium]HQH23375.1 DUF452 family protein [Bacteroidales bacterium]HQJ81380.1 DUF452 family protein [Bacteroidales bacterium]